jgi:hypothetical protein
MLLYIASCNVKYRRMFSDVLECDVLHFQTTGSFKYVVKFDLGFMTVLGVPGTGVVQMSGRNQRHHKNSQSNRVVRDGQTARCVPKRLTPSCDAYIGSS